MSLLQLENNFENSVIPLIGKLKDQLLLEDEQISELLALTPNEYKKAIITGAFNYRSLKNLSQYIGVSIDSIFNNTVDFSLVRKRFIGPSYCIPDRYLVNGGTYIQVIRNKLEYVAKKLNIQTADNILSQLQISKSAIYNDELMVNVELGNKLLEILRYQLDFDEQDFLLMALKGNTSGKRKKIIEDFGHLKKHSDMAKKIVENAHLYEKNFDYSFSQLTHNSFVMKSVGKESLHDAFSTDRLINDETIKFKKSVFETFPIILGKKAMKIFRIESFSHKNRQHVNLYLEE